MTRPTGKGVKATVRRRWPLASLGVLLVVWLLQGSAAHAQIGSDRYSSLVMDAASGSVISTVNPDEPRYPASLTKMMTLYMTFEALRDRRITVDQLVPVSLHAASMPPSKLGLLPATRLVVEEAIEALVTKSANDAAAAVGELLGGGDEARFAQMMTLRARGLGMEHTVFRNASGLPDPDQVSTARDLALLARHLVQDFPAEYRYFSIPSFIFHGRVIPNHDHMLVNYPGADGIKTGYTVASGCNLVTSAVRGNVRLIGVVLGAARAAERDEHMAALLDAGFEQLGVPAEPYRVRPVMVPDRLQMVSAGPAPPLPLPPSPSVHSASVRPASRGRLLPLASSRAAAVASSRAGGHSHAVTILTHTQRLPLPRARLDTRTVRRTSS